MCVSGFWTTLQLLWGSIYIFCGVVQLTVDIFFIVSVPTLHFTSSLAAALVNIFMGICGIVIVAFGKLSPRRQEALLYIACSVLIVNLAAAVLREWGVHFQDLQTLLKDHPYELPILYGCFVVRILAAVVIVASFLDSQLAFCSMQIRPKEFVAAKKLRTSGSIRDSTNDVDMVFLPRKQSKSPPKSQSTVYNAYGQSWVFESQQAAGFTTFTQNDNPKKPSRTSNGYNSSHKPSNENNVADANPVVNIEEPSDDSGSNSERKLNYMKSFSRGASPSPISGNSTPITTPNHNKSSIHKYLEKLTEPEVYRSRLNSALSDRDEEKTSTKAQIQKTDPRNEKVHYASFMHELQKAIVSKKEPVASFPSSKSSSRQESSKSEAKSSDGDFSRELEAALQLIQDLESPNTIETPTDPRITSFGRSSSGSSVETQTTEAPSTFKGKVGVALRHPNSQSTSGYSSPSLPAAPSSWSTSSSISEIGCNPKRTTTVIVLNTSNGVNPKGKSVTLVSITGDDPVLPVDRTVEMEDKEVAARQVGFSGWRSLLRKKKQMARLCPELEGAIVKSESLAYLSDSELLARQQRNNEMRRKIEERVIQQLGVPRTESKC